MEYPREESETEAPSGEEMQKRSKYLMLLVSLVILVIVVLLLRDFLFKPAPAGIPKATPALTPTPSLVTAGFEQPIFQKTFPTASFNLNGKTLEVQRTVEYSDSARRETFVYYNKGNTRLDFQVLFFAPKDLAASAADLTFSSPESRKAVLENDPIILFRYQLKPGAQYTEEVLMPSTSRTCFIYAPLSTQTGDDLDENFQNIRDALNQLGNLEGIVNMDSATAEKCHAVSERVSSLLSSGKTLKEKSVELEDYVSTLVSTLETHVPSGLEKGVTFAGYARAYANELVPGALLTVALGNASEGEPLLKLNGVAYDAQGNLLQASQLLAPGSPRVYEQDGWYYADLLFDLRKLGLRGGQLPVNSISMNLIAFKPQLGNLGSFSYPLLVAVDHVSLEDFINVLPSHFSFKTVNGESGPKPVYIINNLPVPLEKVEGCGFSGTVPSQSFQQFLVSAKNFQDGKCVLQQNGLPIAILTSESEEVPAELASDSIAPVISQSDLESFDWRPCAENYCTGTAIESSMLAFLEKMRQTIVLNVDKTAFQQLFGSNEFTMGFILRTARFSSDEEAPDGVGDYFEFPQGFKRKGITPGFDYFIQVGGSVDLQPGEPLSYRVISVKKTSDKRFPYTTLQGLAAEQGEPRYTYDQQCTPDNNYCIPLEVYS